MRHSVIQHRAEAREVARQDDDAVVEVFAVLADLFGVGGDLFLAPAELDGLEQRDQRGRGGYDDPVLQAILDEGRVLIDGGVETARVRSRFLPMERVGKRGAS